MQVAQSYNIFNRYGKDTDALRDITRAFIEDLNEFTPDQITHGFKAWRRKRDGMPAPANIIDEIKEIKSPQSGALKKFQDWDGGWQSYLECLEARGVMSENLVWKNGKIQLKDGYYPEWTLKDF
jgi:hypothetical protein